VAGTRRQNRSQFAANTSRAKRLYCFSAQTNKGVSLVKANPISLPVGMTDSLRLSPNVSPRQFKIPCASASAKIRVMELINQTITAERIVSVSVPAGFIEADLYDDLLKVTIFERHSNDKQIALGFVNGFGAKVGAVGTITNLDENTLMVVGETTTIWLSALMS
jgi:adenine deaminase